MSQKPFLEAVRIWAAAAWADGEISEHEAAMVRGMIAAGPLESQEQMLANNWLHTRVHLDATELDRLSPRGRRDVFLSAVRVTLADGRLVRTERSFLARLQELLSLDADTAKEVVRAVRDETAAAAPTYAKLYRLPLYTLGHDLTSLGSYRGNALLLVNVASKCKFTPQYEQLQAMYERFRKRGLVVVGFPCNQFDNQEPGTAEEIEQFCKTNFGVTFPMMEKIDVNGERQEDVYALLSEIPDSEGKAGEVLWNFEKFVVSADANSIKRFRSETAPDDPAVIAAIEAALPR
jgi:glutathione peroxidase